VKEGDLDAISKADVATDRTIESVPDSAVSAAETSAAVDIPTEPTDLNTNPIPPLGFEIPTPEDGNFAFDPFLVQDPFSASQPMDMGHHGMEDIWDWGILNLDFLGQWQGVEQGVDFTQ
jgi:hypothetical protein